MEWQPIETAPKDGTWILVADRCYNSGFTPARWSSDSDQWTGNEHEFVWGPTVTHWMPLPAPPRGTPAPQPTDSTRAES